MVKSNSLRCNAWLMSAVVLMDLQSCGSCKFHQVLHTVCLLPVGVMANNNSNNDNVRQMKEALTYIHC